MNIKIKHILNSFSDHYHAVHVERKNQEVKRGKGYWILNASILNDDNYSTEIEKRWNNWRRQNTASHRFPNGGRRERNMSETSPNYTVEQLQKK